MTLGAARRFSLGDDGRRACENAGRASLTGVVGEKLRTTAVALCEIGPVVGAAVTRLASRALLDRPQRHHSGCSLRHTRADRRRRRLRLRQHRKSHRSPLPPSLRACPRSHRPRPSAMKNPYRQARHPRRDRTSIRDCHLCLTMRVARRIFFFCDS